MSKWCFYSPETGLFSGQYFTGSAGQLPGNTPAGYAPIDGWHDHLSTRVDLATGAIIDYQPPAPPDSLMETFAWDALSDPRRPRWRSIPTPAALDAQFATQKQGEIEAVEKTQQRALREIIISLAGNTTPAKAAVDALVVIEASIATIKAKRRP